MGAKKNILGDRTESFKLDLMTGKVLRFCSGYDVSIDLLQAPLGHDISVKDH